MQSTSFNLIPTMEQKNAKERKKRKNSFNYSQTEKALRKTLVSFLPDDF